MVVHPAFLVVFFGVKNTPNSKLLTFIGLPCQTALLLGFLCCWKGFQYEGGTAVGHIRRTVLADTCQRNIEVDRDVETGKVQGFVDGVGGYIPSGRGAVTAKYRHGDHSHKRNTVARVVLPLLETATGHRHVGLCRETCGGKDKGYQDVFFHNGKSVIRYVCCG